MTQADLGKQTGSPQNRLAAPGRASLGASFEPSDAQERQWFLNQLAPGSAAANLLRAFRLRGPLDPAALAHSLTALAARQAILRTTLQSEAGRPRQVIAAPAPVQLPIDDASSLPVAAHAARATAFVEAASQHVFDLATGPLWQAGLLRLAPDDHVLTFVAHPAIMDDTSAPVLLHELETLYASAIARQAADLPPLPIQYSDYAAWQRDSFQRGDWDGHLAYWRQQLAGAPAVLELPNDRPRPTLASQRGRALARVLPASLQSALSALGRQEDSRLLVVLLAGLSLLLQRLTGQSDLVIGAVVAGRDRSELEPLIGLFSNSLALRTDLSGDLTFRELLGRVRDVTRAAEAHQALPFARLLTELQPARNTSYTPLYQVVLEMPLVGGQTLSLAGIEAEPLAAETPPAAFDLTLRVDEQASGLKVTAVFAVDLFDAARMTALLEAYAAVLEQAVVNPDQRLSQFSILTPGARARLPNPAQPLSSAWEGAIHARLSEQAQRAPGHPALISPSERWTYAALEARANQMAQALLAEGLQRGEIIAIYADRSPALVWSLLGILKAGAAYLILDPAYPPARLQDYLALAQPRALLRMEAAGPWPAELASLARRLNLRCIYDLPAGRAAPAFLASCSPLPPAIELGPDDLACVSFTSGSTGRPKGVLCRHGPLTHFMPWQTEAFGYGAADRFSLLAGLSHDPLQRDIFTALWAGATLCLPDPLSWHTPGRLAAWLAESRVTISHLTPPLAQMIVEGAAPGLRLPDLRSVFFVGDRLARHDVARVRALAPNTACFNSYGATETQRAVACYRVPADSEHAPGPAIYPVGHGLPDVQLLVLTPQRQLAGIGELGEIYVRSPHLARGYLQDAALTSARFITNPFTGQPEDRLYRTGDFGRYGPDGAVAFAGRADRQVKLRGYRLEPAEVERALTQHPAVHDAFVTLREAPPAGPALVAYVVGPGADPAQLRAFLAERLPMVMVPAAFIILPCLPLTPNGKLDEAALPAPDLDQNRLPDPLPPASDTEQRLARLWRAALGLAQVGVNEDFFALGGHSLLAARLFSQIEVEFGRALPITLLFRSPTIAQLALALCHEQQPDPWASLVPIQPQGARPPLFLVHGFGGGVLGYAELARLLGDDQPVYGLQAVGLDGRTPPHETVEQMAAHFAGVIRAQQPNGPYFVGGYCFGGEVAFEVARQLQALGQPVALVAIIEGYAPARRQASEPLWRPRLLLAFLRNLPYWFQDYIQLGGRQMWQQARRAALRLLRRAAGRLGRPLTVRVEDVVPVDGPVPEHLRRIMQLHVLASAAYLPGPYAGRVVLFNNRSQSLTRTPDPLRGWGRLVRGPLEIRRIAGSHHKILQPPHVAPLARELHQSLQQSDPAPGRRLDQ